MPGPPGRSRGRNGERGQVMALFALAAVVLVSLAGLALDAGLAYLTRTDLQSHADTASLAGTKMLATDQDTNCKGTTGCTPWTFDYTAIVGQVQNLIANNHNRAGSSQVFTYAAYFVTGSPPNPDCYFATTGSPTLISGTTPCPLGTLPYSCSNGLCTLGYTGVEIAASDTHGTSLVGVLGIHQAAEATTATAIFTPGNGLTGGDFAVYDVTCGSKGIGNQALDVGEDITYHSPSLQKGNGCDDLNDSQFKGCLRDAQPDPPQVPGWITSRSGGGCNFVPVAAGEDITVPLIDCVAHSVLCNEPPPGTSGPEYQPNFKPPYCPTGAGQEPTNTSGKDVMCAWELVTLQADAACLGNGDTCTGKIVRFSILGSPSPGELSDVVELYQ